MRSAGAAVASAVFAVLALYAWFKISDWIIWRSRSQEMVLRLEPVVMALVALIAGRLAGALSPALRWPAALLGVLPLLVLFSVSGRPFNLWASYVIAIALAMVGAYVPAWRRGTTGTPNRAA